MAKQLADDVRIQKRRLPGQRVEENAAETVNIRSNVHRSGVASLLRRHVVRRAQQNALGGQFRLSGINWRRLFYLEACQPDVQNLDATAERRVGMLRGLW